MKKVALLLIMVLCLIVSIVPAYAESSGNLPAINSVHKVSEIPELFNWPERNIFSIEFTSMLRDHFKAKLIKQPDGTTGLKYTYVSGYSNIRTTQITLENGYTNELGINVASDECEIEKDDYGRVYASLCLRSLSTFSLRIYADGLLQFDFGIATTAFGLAPWLIEKYTQLYDNGTSIAGNAVDYAEIGGAMFSNDGRSIYRWTEDKHNYAYKLVDDSDMDYAPTNKLKFVYRDGWFYCLQGRVNINGDYVGYYNDKGYINCGYLIGANDKYLVGYCTSDGGIIRLNYDGSNKTELTRGRYDYSRILSANVYGDTLCCVYINSKGYGAELVLKTEFIDINTGSHSEIGLGDLDFAELYGNYLIYYKANSADNAPMYVWNRVSGQNYEFLDTMAYVHFDQLMTYDKTRIEWRQKFTVSNDYIIYPYISNSKMIVCSKLDGSIKDEKVLELEGHNYLTSIESVNGRVFCRIGNLYDLEYEKWIEITDMIPGYTATTQQVNYIPFDEGSLDTAENGVDSSVNDIGTVIAGPPANEDINTDPGETFHYTIGSYVTFGSYEQSSEVLDGKEPIEWMILDERDGAYLLLSREVLDSKTYHNRSAYVSWEECDLREWLNGEFYYSAFTDEERQKIVETLVTADRSQENPNLDPDVDTWDKVFLLSTVELNAYFSDLGTALCEPTTYAKARGVWYWDYNEGGNGACSWYLRTPAGDLSNVHVVYFIDGVVVGLPIADQGVGVRPAMWVRLLADGFDDEYYTAIDLYNQAKYAEAMLIFRKFSGYKDSEFFYNECLRLHNHQWQNATCTAPKTCSVCGKTEGSALGHSYSRATCQNLAICSRCGLTTGTYAAHNWQAADCYNPKRCTVCGRTEGSALGHNYQYISTYVQQCTRCGNRIGSDPTPTPPPVVHNRQFARSIGIYANSAYASDFYTWKGTRETRQYLPANAFDNNKDTCWVQYAVGHGDFSNVYLGAKWNTNNYVACGVRIRIGMQYQNTDSYNRNSRPREITVRINGKAFDYTLSDTMDWQTLFLPEDITPSNGTFDMRISVWSVYTDKIGSGKTNKNTYADEYAVCIADMDLLLQERN